MTTIGSLFTGYGGLDLAVEHFTGGRTVWACENDDNAAKVIRHRFPGIPNLGDITRVDWSQVPRVDILTGGFPCQDISQGGQRLGLLPGTRSGLWTHMAYAISQLRPAAVVIENVRGLLHARAHSDVEPCEGCLGNGDPVTLRALGAVLGDLASLGYDARWHGLRAADVGAPHGRFRVFVIAADTRGEAGQFWPGLRAGDEGRIGWGRPDDGHSQASPDTDVAGLERREPAGRRVLPDGGAAGVSWGKYAAAVQRWETVLGRRAPSPSVLTAQGARRLSPRFAEWMMGLPDGWVTDVPDVIDQPMLFDGYDPDRLIREAQLRLIGNGVVPQQAYAALAALSESALVVV